MNIYIFLNSYNSSSLVNSPISLRIKSSISISLIVLLF